MQNNITATELARSLSDILNRVRYRGESFIIERAGEPVAALIPPGPTRGCTLDDLVARLGDLELPGEGFADDLEVIQSSQTIEGTVRWPC